MKKDQIELIIVTVSTNAGEVLNLKVYKNGVVCRAGVGGLPELGISLMTDTGVPNYFDTLINKVPNEVLEQPINYEENTPNGYIQYIVAFFGETQNGEHGERADWKKSTGIRVKIDQQSNFNHPIMTFLDVFSMDAAEVTNELYFDAVLHVCYGVTSTDLPDDSMIAAPNTETAKRESLINYIHQMRDSARGWDIDTFNEFKVYKKDEKFFSAIIDRSESGVTIRFEEIKGSKLSDIDKTDSLSTQKDVLKKSWWKRLFS